MSTKTLGYDSSPLQKGKFGNTWRPLSLGVKNDSDLSFAWADLGAAAEGNSMRIRVLGLLVIAAHVQI